MQQKAMKLMASKLAVAGLIEGNFSDEGLSAMSDVQDMTSQMAKELMLGIKDNVEDISATFKKMAIFNPERSREVIPQKSEPDAPKVIISQPRLNISPQRMAEYLAQMEKMKPKRKRAVPDENQLSLFDAA
jgi:hypothetical protein